MNRKSKRDPRRKPKHLDAKGRSTTAVYYLNAADKVTTKTTTFATPEMRKRGRP